MVIAKKHAFVIINGARSCATAINMFQKKRLADHKQQNSG
jgi:hypothetical protein